MSCVRSTYRAAAGSAVIPYTRTLNVHERLNDMWNFYVKNLKPFKTYVSDRRALFSLNSRLLSYPS